MSTQPEVSVVVPAYNAARTIDHCLGALTHQTFPRHRYEILVVDDGSSDGTRARVEAYSAVRLVTQDHAGPAAARNLGVQQAVGDILLFTDSDCAPAEDWIEQMLAPFDDVDVAGDKGAYTTQQREIVARFVQLEYESKYDRMAEYEYIDFVDTYAAGYRRELFVANGGFDPIFQDASVEDQEFSFRLARQGHRLVFVREARVCHLSHPDKLSTYWRRKFRIGYWKVLVTRRYPEKAWHDSHTPQILKAQILLVGLSFLCFLGGLLWRPLWWGFAAALAVFLLSTLSFVGEAWGKDPLVALVSPALLFLRGLALGTGFAAGLVAHRGTQQKGQGTANEQGAAIAEPDHGPLTQVLDHSGWHILLKRAIDIVGGTMGLLVSVPVVPIAALLIKLDSRGPVFFVQDRVGENGRVFQMYKLRTMVGNAEELLDELIDLETLEQPVYKLRDDPRVTRVGRFLRRWSLDELPQFLNVLKGDMSLVGPRPEEVRVVRYYNAWHRQRLRVKPGVTGPVQINGRGDLSLEERMRLELDYIHNYSLARDLKILLQTIPVVIRGNGSY